MGALGCSFGDRREGGRLPRSLWKHCESPSPVVSWLFVTPEAFVELIPGQAVFLLPVFSSQAIIKLATGGARLSSSQMSHCVKEKAQG